ncbi:MAG: NusA antitermination factor, partial [Clostridia bacterium]|nr:NusA antitermination factor [Clostridia bacterium]
IKRLFEIEIPEIADGTVEIKSISREAGSRTKVAVLSSNPDVDAVGSCIGPKQARINSILGNLKGERIDLIKYSEDPAEFVVTSLSPATVHLVEIDREIKNCKVAVATEQLSLAIGKTGQNVRLAARLTGYRIDIVSE